MIKLIAHRFVIILKGEWGEGEGSGSGATSNCQSTHALASDADAALPFGENSVRIGGFI